MSPPGVRPEITRSAPFLSRYRIDIISLLSYYFLYNLLNTRKVQDVIVNYLESTTYYGFPPYSARSLLVIKDKTLFSFLYNPILFYLLFYGSAILKNTGFKDVYALDPVPLMVITAIDPVALNIIPTTCP